MSENVKSLFGGFTGERKINERCIEELEDALERARAGETVGVGIVEQSYDGLARWSAGGVVGRYSILGAITLLQRTLADHIGED